MLATMFDDDDLSQPTIPEKDANMQLPKIPAPVPVSVPTPTEQQSSVAPDQRFRHSSIEKDPPSSAGF